jgi:phenol 2-monooxygenase
MNVSMQDAFNLGWKLAAVLQKRSLPSLLRTYSEERQAVAQNLIDFDREWAAMLSTSSSAAEVQRYFVQHGRYTAGTATVYKPALLTGGSEHQQLAIGLQIGTRFHSAPVIRIGDGKVMQLGETLAADGRWRLIAFAGQSDDASSSSPIRALCNYLTQSPDSPVKRFSKQGTDIDTVFDVRAVFQKSHADLPMTAMPDLLFPSKGRYGLRDYEKAFCAIATQTQDIYAMRGIDRQNGCLVIVRPDQYIASVLPLAGYEELNRFFHGFMLAQN